jgi:hypothetical protein
MSFEFREVLSKLMKEKIPKFRLKCHNLWRDMDLELASPGSAGLENTVSEVGGCCEKPETSASYFLHNKSGSIEGKFLRDCFVARLRDCCVARLHYCCMIVTFQGCVSRLRYCCVARLHDCCVARSHDCCVARLRDCCVARLRDCCVARLRDCCVERCVVDIGGLK